MNDALRMQISAFVDGELPENENELLLRRLSQDTALRQQVAQYLTIGRLIRRDHEVPGMHELRDRIAAALGEEPVQLHVEPEIPTSRFTKPALGVAIAASVAVVALLGIRQIYAPAVDVDPIEDNFAGRSVPASQTAVDQADDELLKQFFLHHDPRLVTLQQEIELEEEPSDDEETDEESQD